MRRMRGASRNRPRRKPPAAVTGRVRANRGESRADGHVGGAGDDATVAGLAEATTDARREPESPRRRTTSGNAAAKREEKKRKGKAPESAEGDADEATRKRRVETFEESSR